MAKALGKIQQYREELKKRGIARAERFEVEFNVAGISSEALKSRLPTSSGSLQKSVTLFCEEVQIPGMILSNKEFNIGPWTFFRNTKIGFLGNEINFTFVTTEDWDLRGFFEQWMKECASTHSQELGYIDDITTTVEIKSLDLQGNVKKSWTLYEAMPKVLNLVPLSSGTTSAIRNTLIISAAWWESSSSEQSEGLTAFQSTGDD